MALAAAATTGEGLGMALAAAATTGCCLPVMRRRFTDSIPAHGEDVAEGVGPITALSTSKSEICKEIKRIAAAAKKECLVTGAADPAATAKARGDVA